jgi:TonB-dependent receptor
MQNDKGEARDIIIRGLASELNSVSLNGDRIPSVEGDYRRVQMDLIPSDMIQTIEVNKTLTSDMDADAIGGSVNLVTRAAPNGLRLSGTLSSGYNPIRQKALYTGSYIAGNRFFSNKLGVILSGSYNNNDYGTDDIQATWKQDDDRVYIEEQEIRQYFVQRIRRSVSLASDFKINPRNILSLSGMYNWRDDRENRYKLSYTDIEADGTGFIGSVQRETKGGINNNQNKNARLEEHRVKNLALKGNHFIASKFDLDWSLSYSDAKELKPNERYINFEAEGQSISLNIDDPYRPFAGSSTELADYELNSITENRKFTREDETGAKINLKIPFSLVAGQKGKFQAGSRLRVKDKSRLIDFFEYSPIGADKDSYDHLTLLPSISFSGNNFQPGSQYVPGTFASREYLGRIPLANSALFESEDKPDEYASENYTAKEAIMAGYVRFDQNLSSRLLMILGNRFEHTSLTYTGYIIEDEETVLGKRTSTNSYLNILPSAAFKYSAKDNLVVRLAATTSLARPNYYDLTPYFDNRVEEEELLTGNEALKAAYAWNFDFSAEKFFSSVGILSAGIFHKNISNFIYKYRNAAYSSANFSSDFPEITNPIAEGDEWTFIQPRNGKAVQLSGIELAFQRQLDFLPGMLKNFGVYLNYTYTQSKTQGVFNEDGEERTDAKFPGTAPHIFNSSLSYETKRLSSRISANYADSYLYELGGDKFDDSYYDSQFFLDANASYRITKKVRLFGEANNLTNQPLRFYQGVKARTMQVEFYRARYNLGIKFDI